MAALSLREVVRRGKTQAPILYTYYPSKMPLYDALFLDGVRTYAAYRESPMGVCLLLDSPSQGYGSQESTDSDG